MNKKLFPIIIFMLAANLFICCRSIDISNKRILYFSIYPADTTESTYLFEIYNNKEMICTKGIRDWQVNEKIRFEEIEENKIITLSDECYKNILKIVEAINECGNLSRQEGIYNDYLEIFVITEKSKINRFLEEATKCDKYVSELINIVEKISPIELFFRY